MNRTLIAATLVVASAWARARLALGVPKQSPECSHSIDAGRAVRCALAASPEVREAREQLAAVAGRRDTAGVWLPSNPAVGFTVATRRRPSPASESALNWSVTLSQQFELAGQRGARMEAVDAEAAAQARRVGVAEQEVAAGALTAYHEVIAAEEGVRFAVELSKIAEALARFAEARAAEALLAGVEADVARAESTRIGLMRIEAERRLENSRAALAIQLDVEPNAMTVANGGPWVAAAVDAADGGALEAQALMLRGEIGAAEMERKVLERRLSLVRRERVPNLTVSAFAERGEIDDRILGFGLSVPLPLPAPVGRSRAGEIAETLAQLRAAESSTERVRRRVRLEVARALSVLRARQAAVGLFEASLLERARADLSALREAIAARQLSVREGLLWQRSLVDLLQSDIEVRLARALAWVELRRVVGLSLSPPEGDKK